MVVKFCFIQKFFCRTTVKQNKYRTILYKDIYLRDPQGNVMAVYRIAKDSLFLTELPMYGEKRLGVIKENKFLMKKPAGKNVSFGVINFTNFSLGKQNGKQTVYTLGKKHYETTDRLGNVRVTYTDKKS